MLHRVLLRLSCFFALLLFGSIGGLHLYKKDIALFLLQRVVTKNYPTARVTLDDVDLSLPLKVTLKNITITEGQDEIFSVKKVKIAINPLQPFCTSSYSGQTLFCLDDARFIGVRLSKALFKDSPPNVFEKTHQTPIKLHDILPKIGVRHASFDCTYNNQYAFQGEGSYFHDQATLSYSLQDLTDSALQTQGHLHILKDFDLLMESTIREYKVETRFNLETLWKGDALPFFASIENIPVQGVFTQRNNLYTLSLSYKKQKELSCTPYQNVLDLIDRAAFKVRLDRDKNLLTWVDGDALFTCSKTPIHITLDKPADFDLLKKRLLSPVTLNAAKTSWTLLNLELQDKLSGNLKGTIPLLEIFEGILPQIKGIQGRLDVQASLSGTMENPLCIFQIKPHHVRHTDYPELNLSKTRLSLMYKDQKLWIESAITPLKGIQTTLKGQIDSRKFVDLSVNISSDLNLLQPLLPPKERLQGILSGLLTLKGPLNHLTLSGEGHLKKGLYGNYAVGTHIHPITGNWSLKGDQVNVILQGRDDFQGTVNCHGKIQLPWLQSILNGVMPSSKNLVQGRIELSLKKFFLGQSDLFTAKADGHLFLDLDKMSIGGNLTLDPTIVDLDQLTPAPTPKLKLRSGPLKSDILDPREEISDQPNREESSSKGPFLFDIHIHPKRPVVVRGFGIESTWDGKLNLKGNGPAFYR
ncbi:MAG: translocation/assembly module TamB domain-containing protein [Chitinophagaceae bacterium]